MELLEQFKHYLLSQKNRPSDITIKNYLADTRKFINWFEKKSQRSFDAKLVSSEIIESYKRNLLSKSETLPSQLNSEQAFPSISAESSLKRYLSSLRKFFEFLKQNRSIEINPFEQASISSQNHELKDPYHIKEFKHFLIENRSSYLTIKNYIIDIEQFLSWTAEVTKTDIELTKRQKHVLDCISSELIEEYKMRLLNDAKFSPASVNRKLSSLRKYTSWCIQKGYIRNQIDIRIIQHTSQEAQTTPLPSIKLEQLTTFEKQLSQTKSQERAFYSPFAPIRMFQKIIKAINLLFDVITINPLVKSIEGLEYLIWKIKGKKVFIPVDKMLKESDFTSYYPINKNQILTKSSTGNIANVIPPFFPGILRLKKSNQNIKIHNISKSLYAPLASSTKNYPWYKKGVYLFLYKQPEWYKKYQKYTFFRYIRFAVLFITISSLAFISYYSLLLPLTAKKIPFLQLPLSPPRILSFEGRLTNKDNSPITTAQELRFVIYNDQFASNSARLWEEVHTVVPDGNGNFSILLGADNKGHAGKFCNNGTPPLSPANDICAIPQSLFANNPALWLGISIGENPELAPRQQLANVAKAVSAQSLDGLSPITQTANTSNVVLALDSAGNLTIGGTATPTFQAIGGQFTLSGKTLILNTTAGTNSNIELNPDGTGFVDIQKPIKNTSNNNNIPSSQGALEIDDLVAILATSSGQSALTLNQDSTGPLISASVSGIARFTVDNYGTGTFSNNLGVNGNALTTNSSVFNLVNTNAENLYIGGNSSFITIASTSGTTIINNSLSVSGTTSLNGGATIPVGRNFILNGTIASDIVPITTGSFNLGSPSLHFANAYIDNLFLSNSATISGYWQRSNGIISSLIASDNIFLGNIASGAGQLQIYGSSATLPVASISGRTTNAAFVVDTLGNGDVFAASTSGKNRFVIAYNGNVGIGSPVPSFKLDVADTQTASAVAQFYNNSTATTAAGVVVKLGNTSHTTINTSNHFVSFETAGIGIVGSIQGNGATGIQLAQSGIADWAEYIKKDSTTQIPFGSLVCLNQNGNAQACQISQAIIGVASSHPTIIAGQDQGNTSIAVGMTGIVRTYVSTANGTILPGDMITASTLPGVGVKAIKAGQIVGRAIEGFSGKNTTGSILVEVNPGWYDPDVYVTDTGNLNLSEDLNQQYVLKDSQRNIIERIAAFAKEIVGNIQAGAIEVQSLSTSSLFVATDNITIGGKTLKDYIASTLINILQNKYQLPSLSLTANSLQTNFVSPIASDSAIALRLTEGKLAVLNSNTASSAAVATIDNQGNASFSGQLTTNGVTTTDATISGTLHARKIIADDIESLSLKAATLSANYITNIYNIIQSVTASESANASSSAEIASLSSATESATLATESGSLIASSSASTLLTNSSWQLKTQYSNISSFSSVLTNVPTLSSDFAQFNQGLMVFGSSSLSDVSVSGNLYIGASMTIADNAINTLGGDLLIEQLRQGNVQFESGLVAIDTDGNLSVSGNATFIKDIRVNGKIVTNILAPHSDSDLIVKLGEQNTSNSSLVVQNASQSGIFKVSQIGDIIASGSGTFSHIVANGLQIVRGVQADTSMTETVASSSAGTAIVIAHETERTILSPYITKSSLIYLTAASDTQGITPYIARQTENNPNTGEMGSFTIAIPYPLYQDIKVNWWIVN